MSTQTDGMSSAEHSCWFVRKVICWRAAASVAWAVLLLPPITAAFVILSRFSLLHPIQTISECLFLLTSASAVFSLILLCGVILVVGFLNLEYYTVIPTIACSKIALLGQLLHPRQLLNSLVHSIMGMIVAWCCAITIGGRYETLGYPCPQSDGPTRIVTNTAEGGADTPGSEELFPHATAASQTLRSVKPPQSA